MAREISKHTVIGDRELQMQLGDEIVFISRSGSMWNVETLIDRRAGTTSFEGRYPTQRLAEIAAVEVLQERAGDRV